MAAWLVFPNQLFKYFTYLPKETLICLVEEPLFFSDPARSTTFAKIKLAYTRATMRCFAWKLKAKGFQHVEYIQYKEIAEDGLEGRLEEVGPSFKYFNVVDNLLEAKLKRFKKVKLECVQDNPSFLYTEQDLDEYLSTVKTDPFHQTTFYRHFRLHRSILLTKTGGFVGGKLTFDSENRKKMPKGTIIPDTFTRQTDTVDVDGFWAEAAAYVQEHFPDNPGDLKAASMKEPFFALDHDTAEEHLKKFVEERFDQFGPYQDTFTSNITSSLKSGTLFHSCISPYINNGLLSPQQVIDLAVASNAPIQSVEGFVRQVMGWREFIRLVYREKGEEMRASNQLGNSKALDERWYKGNVGCPPVDDAIKYAFRYGYLHHILRLMVVANFMNLSRIHPTEMFRWFLDFSLDAYDWVMIGNVYGMASFASPVMSTKPYISGSNYIRKMSDYPDGPWCSLWDALFYAYLHAHQETFAKNGRMNMMLANLRRKEGLDGLLKKADKFLGSLSVYGKRSLPDE